MSQNTNNTAAVASAGTTCGRLVLIMGPMFAGKSSELQRRIKREIHACRRCCIVRYGKDNRYSNNYIATHDQSHIKPTFSAEKLEEIGLAWQEYDTICIDEGQFFPDLLEFCTDVADAGKTVIVSALDGDFLRRPFGKICELIPRAEEVMKLTAVCMACHEREAAFTRRTVESSETELIGGADMYIAVCRQCYNNDHPPTPGRVSRYKQNVKEVERMCLRGLRASAEIRPEGSPANQKATSLADSKNNNNNNNNIVLVTATEGSENQGASNNNSSSSSQNQNPQQHHNALRRSRDENRQPSSQDQQTQKAVNNNNTNNKKKGNNKNVEEGEASPAADRPVTISAVPPLPPLASAK